MVQRTDFMDADFVMMKTSRVIKWIVSGSKKLCVRPVECSNSHEVLVYSALRLSLRQVKCSLLVTLKLHYNFVLQHFCSICNLFDDSEEATLIYHCHLCGICRKKAHESFKYKHCDRCCMCYPSSILTEDGEEISDTLAQHEVRD